MLQNCDKDKLEKCKQQAKELRAAASGKKMVACIEEAGENETAMKACKMALAKSGLQ